MPCIASLTLILQDYSISLILFVSFGMLQPKATFKFPLGEVSLEEKEEEEVKRMLSINGIIKGHLLNGVCTAQYNDESLKLRYLYKVVFSECLDGECNLV